MKFMVSYELLHDTRDEAIKRFKKSQGAAPAGVTMLGRWHRADASGGFTLVETNDARTITDFALEWSDLLRISAVPVIDDAQLSEAFDILSRK